MRLFPLGKNYNSKKKKSKWLPRLCQSLLAVLEDFLFLSHAIFTDWCDHVTLGMLIYHLSNYSVYMEYHKRKPGEPGKSQRSWVISNLTLNIFRLSIYRKYQNTQQQLDITAVLENKVCFKYRPRCNKFLFLPFIRPITVQDSKVGEEEEPVQSSKVTKPVCIPFPPHCCPTGYKMC